MNAHAGSFLRVQLPPLTVVFFLLLSVTFQTAAGQSQKHPSTANGEDGRSASAAEDKIAGRKGAAMAYYKKGDLTHAREQFEALHMAEPRDVSVAVLLGYVYVKLGLEVEAIDLLTPLEQGHEGNTDLEYVLAFSLIRTGKYKEGVPRMEQVARATHSANAYVIAGSADLQRGKMREALTDLNAANRLDSTIPGLPTMVGQAQYGLGDLNAAVLAFRAALRTNPEDFTANLDLGAIRLKQRDFKTARPLLELALQLQPKFPLARLEIAKLNIATGKYAEAAAGLEDLAKAEPNWFEAHWQLAIAYFDLSRPEDGKRERMLAQRLQSQQQDEGPDAK